MNFHEFKALPRSGTGLRLEDQDPRLFAAVQDPAVMLCYSPTLRDYMVPEMKPRRIPRRYSIPPKKRMPDGRSIWFCPFTGHLLPGRVFEAWHHRAKKIRADAAEYMVWGDKRRSIPGLRGEQWWVKEEVGPTFSGMTQREAYDHIKAPPYNDYLGPHTWAPPGFWRSEAAPDHYCHGVAECFWSLAPQYYYLAHVREYGFRIADIERRLDFQPIKILAAPYCPWCGEELPRSLRPEWEEQMRARGFDPEGDEIPADLNTDTWWREAGL